MRDLEPPGVLSESGNYDFSFNRVEKQFETYSGVVMKVRYFILVTINRSYNRVTREEEFIVYNPSETDPEFTANIKNEVGIDGVLHIEFEFDKSHYHLKDCVLGKIFFN
jgi:vacuolar protein sorting-associated protein 26